MISIEEGHTLIAEDLIRAGANVQQVDSDKWTALSYASAISSSRIISLLLRKNADAHVIDSIGNSILDISPSSHCQDLIRCEVGRQVLFQKSRVATVLIDIISQYAAPTMEEEESSILGGRRNTRIVTRNDVYVPLENQDWLKYTISFSAMS